MKIAYAGLLVLGLTSIGFAADWPQYRGVNSDGKSTEPGILKKWPSEGPHQVWKRPVNLGFSSFTVSGQKAFTLDQRSIEGVEREGCLAIDASTGRELWFQPIAVAKYDGGAGPGDGPRGTPSVDGDKVYAISEQLVVSCFDSATGKVIWSRDLIKEHAGKNISWQNAASPLIEGNLVFVGGGGQGQSLLGLDKATGKVVWKSENERITHATPIAATILGQRQIIFFTQSGLVSVQPNDGKVLWRHKFPYRTSTAASPIAAGDIVYCSAGYDVGSMAARVSKEGNEWKTTELWRASGNRICNHWSTPIELNGYLYGMFGFKQHKTGPVKCVELATGKEMWSQNGFGPGNLIAVGPNLLALSDAGDLVLIDPSPNAYKEMARTHALEGKCWSTPIVSSGRIYARSSTEAVCLDVAERRANP
jgi:outer membrane protein assembly factor BamB